MHDRIYRNALLAAQAALANATDALRARRGLSGAKSPELRAAFIAAQAAVADATTAVLRAKHSTEEIDTILSSTDL